MVAYTRYPDVSIVIAPLLAETHATLGEQLVGMYLFGSLANSDFDRESDVDILVATRVAPSCEQFDALKMMHTRIAQLDSWCATQLEVSYIPLAALRRYNPTDNLHPRLDRGKGATLYMMFHDSDWVVQRHLIRERGIVLWGPPPQTLIDPVSSDDLCEAMRPVLEDWLAHVPETPDEIRSQGYQAYIVLTVCRVLYTVEFGTVISKRAAADWAKETLDGQWTSLIERAWRGRQNPTRKPEASEIEETFDFIRFALERAGRVWSR